MPFVYVLLYRKLIFLVWESFSLRCAILPGKLKWNDMMFFVNLGRYCNTSCYIKNIHNSRQEKIVFPSSFDEVLKSREVKMIVVDMLPVCSRELVLH